MSNLRNTSRFPLRTNQQKAPTLTNDLLERKTRALEGSFNNLKFTTTQRDQTKSTIELNHSKPNKTMSKPNSTVKTLIITQIIKCGQCEKEDAKMKCLECVENYCTDCYTKFHLRGALQRHRSVFLSSNVRNTPTIHKQESTENSDEKSTLASFHRSFLQWREKNSKHQIISPPIDHSIKLPLLNFDEINSTKKSPQTMMKPSMNYSIHIHHSNEPQIIDKKPSPKNLSPIQTTEIHTNLPVEEERRPSTRVSIKSNSRPNSSSIVDQASFRCALESKSTEELENIIQTQIILSRPVSANSQKFDEVIPNPTNVDTEELDPIPNDLLDETKIELTQQNSTTTPTPRRHSPFSFSNPLYRISRMNSESSRGTGDLGFFTDVPPQQAVLSPLPPSSPSVPILECSTINEWKDSAVEEQQQSIEQIQANDTNPSSSSTLTNDSSTDTATTKDMSADIAVTVTDTDSSSTLKPELETKIDPIVQISNVDVDQSNKSDVIVEKKTRRRKLQSKLADYGSDGYRRKLEFSFGDGLHWQEASLESLTSSSDSIPPKQTSRQSASNVLNIELAEQYSIYDNDDGRSSRVCQNSNDDECFEQLHQELCTELDIQGSDEDALMNEQLLRILRDIPNPFNKINSMSTIETDIQ